MKEFGAALRNAREKAGLSIRDLYERTRINPKYLDALEAGNIPSLPQTYVRAFVRDYAREVGLDEEQVLARYNELAEQAKGIAPPPPPPDTSALIPKMDDTIEIVGERREEEEATVQREEIRPPAEYFHPRRIELDVAPSVPEQKAARPAKEAKPPGETIRAKEPEREKPKELPKSEQASTVKEPAPIASIPTPLPAKPAAEEAPRQTAAPSPPAPDTAVGEEAKPVAAPAEQTEAAADSHKGLLHQLLSSEAEAEKKKARAKQGKPTRVYDTRPIPPSDPEYGTTKEPEPKPAGEKKAPPKKKPPALKGTPDSQRRARIAAWLIIIIICVTLYAVVEFGGKKEEPVAAKADSSQIAARMRAKSFVDSTQFVIPQEINSTQETTSQKNPKEEEAMEPVKQVFAAEDSLVLEAFSTSSVWFAIRMDTTRSERGSLGANDHRIWKAKERFVVTLGDAGAVTFMLNGTDLGALGDAGSVAKNVTISRSLLRK